MRWPSVGQWPADGDEMSKARRDIRFGSARRRRLGPLRRNKSRRRRRRRNNSSHGGQGGRRRPHPARRRVGGCGATASELGRELGDEKSKISRRRHGSEVSRCTAAPFNAQQMGALRLDQVCQAQVGRVRSRRGVRSRGTEVASVICTSHKSRKPVMNQVLPFTLTVAPAILTSSR